ncbi:MAG: DNA polymerase III subunit delta [Nitrospinota bacterium]|nr:DNA polymerase III subunit delta [Nitrospinota bacterium]
MRTNNSNILLELENINSAEIPSVILLFGKNFFLRDQFIEKIRSQSLSEDENSFNHDFFDLNNVSLMDVQAASQTFPFISDKRLIEIKNSEKFNADDKEQLEKMIEDKVDSVILFFISDKVDVRSIFYKIIKKYGKIFDVDTFPNYLLKDWTIATAKTLGINLTKDVSEFIFEVVEPSMGHIYSELKKLRDFVGVGGNVSINDVSNLVGRSKVDAIFKLGDLFLQGNLEEALVVVRRLLSNEAPEMLLGVLRSNVSRWLACKIAVSKGLDDSKIIETTKIPKFLLKNVKNQSKNLSVSYLRYLCLRLQELDRRIKREGDKSNLCRLFEIFFIESHLVRRKQLKAAV